MPDVIGAVGLVALLLPAAYLAVALDRALAGAGGAALVSPLQDTARLLVQRRRTTVAPDALLWRASGAGLLVVAALMVAVVPVGGPALVDIPVGVVWITTMDVVVWALLWLLGWGPNSYSSLVGGYRFLALALAYELPLMFALTGPAVYAGSLDVRQVVAAQQDGLWNVLTQPVGFLVLLLGTLGFSVLGPFAQPAAGDLAGGVLAELSGVDRLVVLVGREALLVAGAAVSVPMFLGGDSGPLLPGALWVAVKTAVVLTLLVVLRRRLPLLRADRLLEVGFLVLLPLAVAQLLVPSLLVYGDLR